MARTRENTELAALNYWYQHPDIEPKFAKKNFRSRLTADLFMIMRANRRRYGGAYISASEVVDAMWKNERFNYLLDKEHWESIMSVLTYDDAIITEAIYKQIEYEVCH